MQILDDKNARKVASQLGLNLTGTYGLLKTLKEKGHITESMFITMQTRYGKNLNSRINFDKIKWASPHKSKTLEIDPNSLYKTQKVKVHFR